MRVAHFIIGLALFLILSAIWTYFYNDSGHAWMLSKFGLESTQHEDFESAQPALADLPTGPDLRRKHRPHSQRLPVEEEAPSAEPPDWHVSTGIDCQKGDPRAMLAMGQLLGQALRARDVREHGIVVQTTLDAPDGSHATFYRTQKRCEAAIRSGFQDLGRYN